MALLAVNAAGTAGLADHDDVIRLNEVLLASLVGFAVVYVVNVYWAGPPASSLFVLLLLVVISVADEPQHIIEGRSMFLFFIPILVASVVLRPWAGFVVAGLSSVEVSLLALAALGRMPPIPSMLAFFAVAWVAWTGSRSLERALRDLQTSEFRYRAVVEDQSELICRFRPNGTITFVNQAFRRYFGLEGREAVGCDIRSLLTEVASLDTECEELFATLCTPSAAQAFECPVRVGGETRWIQWTNRAIPGGTRDRAVEHQAVGRDVTERVRAENALQESEETYRTLVETSPDAIILMDLAGRLVACNGWFPRLYGFENLDEMRTAGLATGFDLIVESDRYRAGKDLRQALEVGVIRGVEYTAVRKSGETFPVEISIAAVRDVRGQPRAFMTLSRDVSERKRMEAHIRQTQRMEAMGRLASGVAHDFNNYLTVMDSYARLLLDDLRSDDPNRRDVEQIVRAAEMSSALVGQLLAFSRTQMLRPRVLCVNKVISRAEDVLRRLAGRGIDLAVECAPDAGPVRADPGQVEQILLNLVTNARDAIPDVGTITIRTANVEVDQVDGEPVEPAPYVMISVSDTGVGMDEGTRARIFEPFFTTKENGTGTGLGLSTVYGIVRQSGGHIRVRSELGRGTTFEVCLPRVSDR
jgi:PAS domain S-box-containing protein